MALKHGGANALLELDIDGNEQLALTKQVQVDPIRRVLEHLDFVAVRSGEKVTVDVPSTLVGDAAPETLVVTENATVSVEAEATHIPEFIEVSIEGAEAGTQILAKDLVLPEGSTLLTDPRTLIVNITDAARPPRSSRPSWRRPRPRPASSATSDEETPRPVQAGRGRPTPRATTRE